MDLKLKGKTALVTGSTAGIGYGIAKKLAEEGAHVIINGRKEGPLKKAVNTLQKETENTNITGIAANLSYKEDIDQIIAEYQEVDILINNVGIFNQVDFCKNFR